MSAKMKVAHLGINAANAENAAQIAELFHVLFGFEPKYGNSSIFVGDKMNSGTLSFLLLKSFHSFVFSFWWCAPPKGAVPHPWIFFIFSGRLP